MPLTKHSDIMDRIDYTHNNSPKCPFCDHEIDISASELYELYDEGEHIINCPRCEREMTVRCEVKYLFSTDEQPELD